MTAAARIEPSNVESQFTGEKLELRKKTLGASEIAAVAGLSPWGETSLDVYLSKHGLKPHFQGNEYTEWGNRLEPEIGRKYSDTLIAVLDRGVTFIRPSEPWQSATPDFIAQEFGATDDVAAKRRWGVECKNRNARLAYMFGETGTDQVPHDVAAQCYWGMIVTDLPWWDVAVLIGGCEFRWFRLYRDETIEADLQEIGHDFWHNNVLKAIEPPIDGSQSWSDHLKRKFAKHGEELREATEAEVAYVLNLAEIRAEKKKIEEQESELENLLKNAIGESAGIVSPFGRVTWKAPKHGNPKWKDIAEKLGATPDLIEEHRGTASRKFLFTPAKEAK